MEPVGKQNDLHIGALGWVRKDLDDCMMYMVDLVCLCQKSLYFFAVDCYIDLCNSKLNQDIYEVVDAFLHI